MCKRTSILLLAGLSPAIAEPVWRKLVAQCIAHEFGVWDRTRG